MANISFYHITGDTPAHADATLPSLLEKILSSGQQAWVMCPTAQRCQRLDETLWTYADSSFLPHGTPQSTAPAPVLLTHAEEMPDESQLAGRVPLFLAGTENWLTTETQKAGPESKILYFFTAAEADLARARPLYKELKAKAENTVVYYQQTATGWQKK